MGEAQRGKTEVVGEPEASAQPGMVGAQPGVAEAVKEQELWTQPRVAEVKEPSTGQP